MLIIQVKHFKFFTVSSAEVMLRGLIPPFSRHFKRSKVISIFFKRRWMDFRYCIHVGLDGSGVQV